MKPGNSAEDKTLTIRKRRSEANIGTENPPFMTVNTQLISKLWAFEVRPE
jgi:hypothetical protein